MNNRILIIILLCVYKIACQQSETNNEDERQDEEEERIEEIDSQKAEKDLEAEENEEDDKWVVTQKAEKDLEAEENEEDDKWVVTQKAEKDLEAEENEEDDKVEELEQHIERNDPDEGVEEQVKFEDYLPYEENEEDFPKKEMDEERKKEKEAGDPADLFGTNQHYHIPPNFEDFGRRFIWAYPYIAKNLHGTVGTAELKLDRDVKDYLEAKEETAKLLTPVKAPPEFVLAIAKQSAILEGSKPMNPSEDIINKNILRTGKFWDGVWKEDVDVDRLLRTSNKNSDELERVTVQIEPGSKLYELILKLKKISPTLLYVINKNNDN